MGRRATDHLDTVSTSEDSLVGSVSVSVVLEPCWERSGSGV